MNRIAKFTTAISKAEKKLKITYYLLHLSDEIILHCVMHGEGSGVVRKVLSDKSNVLSNSFNQH